MTTLTTEQNQSGYLSREGDKPDPEYLKALEKYWNCEVSSAIEVVTDAIERNPDGTETFPFYRLWIQQLAEIDDRPSLSKLCEHLMARSYENPDMASYWAALRGIIHLELDEIDAVDLLLRAISPDRKNPYTLEFLQKANLGREEKGDPVLHLQSSEVGLADYFHWQAVVSGLHVVDNPVELTRATYRASQLFPDSPLSEEQTFFRHYQRKSYSDAATVAGRLHKRFPNRTDYVVYSGMSNYWAGNYSQALSALVAHEESNPGDPDILRLMAACYEESAQGNASAPNHTRAIEAYQAAIEAYQDYNLPIVELQASLDQLQRERNKLMEVEEEDLTSNQAWLHLLTQTEYFELCEGGERRRQTITKTLGNQVQTGDVVFFAAESPLSGDQRWNVVAMYSVASGPTWSPISQLECQLKLIHLMERPLSVEIQVQEGSLTRESGQSEQESHNLFNLESGALDIIEEAVRERVAESGEERESDLEHIVKRLRKSS